MLEGDIKNSRSSGRTPVPIDRPFIETFVPFVVSWVIVRYKS